MQLTLIFAFLQPDDGTTGKSNQQVWKHLADLMTPSIIKVVEFAKQVPGFVEVRQPAAYNIVPVPIFHAI